jgi:hypothetical protein
MMNRRAWTGTCAAVVSLATAGVLAQTAPQTAPQPTPQTPAQQSAPSSSANKITVTGCLKAAPSAATDTATAANANPAATTGTAGSTTPEPAGTTGTTAAGTTPTTPGAAPADARFILTAATLVPAAADAAGAAPANAAGTAQTYRLIANPTALSEHVGKKLELTGTIDTTSTADPKDPSAAAPALRVESGKIVAASCQ